MTTKTFKTPKTVNVLLVRTDGLTCSFQTDRGWVNCAERALEEDARQNIAYHAGDAEARYVKCFMSCDNVLTEYTFMVLREDLEAGNILEGPFTIHTVTVPDVEQFAKDLRSED